MKKTIILLITFALIISVVACARPMRRPAPNNNNVPQQTRVIPRRVTPVPRRAVPAPTPAPTPAPRYTAPNTTVPRRPVQYNNTVANNDYTLRANKIAGKIAALKQIDTATCVITGNTALVGVQFDKQYKGKVTTDVKNLCARAAKQADPTINNVVVTADPDVYSRIKTMLGDIGKGKPISGFATEIRELLNRVQPK